MKWNRPIRPCPVGRFESSTSDKRTSPDGGCNGYKPESQGWGATSGE